MMKRALLGGLLLFLIAGCGSQEPVAVPDQGPDSDSARHVQDKPEPPQEETPDTEPPEAADDQGEPDAGTHEPLSSSGRFSRELKVLYLEQRPSFQWRYLNDVIRRDTELIYQSFLFDADPGWRQPVSSGSRDVEPLQAPFWDGALVRDKQSFLDIGYDVVMLGDIDPVSQFWRREYWEWLEAFVQQGGGLILLPGSGMHNRLHMGVEAARRLHPVDLRIPPSQVPRVDTSTMKYWGRTQPNHDLFKMSAVPERNDELWGVETDGEFARGQLRGLYWYHPTAGAVEGATVLGRVAVPGKPISEGDVVVATMDYGKGRVLWIGSDDTWLWREYFGDHYFYRFVTNAFRHVTKDGV